MAGRCGRQKIRTDGLFLFLFLLYTTRYFYRRHPSPHTRRTSEGRSRTGLDHENTAATIASIEDYIGKDSPQGTPCSS